MRFFLFISLFFLTFSEAKSTKPEFLKTCQKIHTHNICKCSYSLFTRRFQPEEIKDKEKQPQLQKYVQACTNLSNQLNIYSFDKFEKIVTTSQHVNWKSFSNEKQNRLLHIIKESRRVYFKTCQVGFEQGCFNIATIYQKGLTTAKNLSKAKLFLKKACQNGMKSICH